MSLSVIPPFEGTLLKYTKKFISKNHWKFSAYHTIEDLLQESYVVYAKCKNAYQDTVDNPGWFMSLYKSALSRRFIDIAKECTHYKSEITIVTSDEDVHDILDTIHGESTCYVELEDSLRKAPRPVKELISLFEAAPDILETIEGAWKGHGKKKVYQNEHICQLLGYDSKEIDIAQMLKDLVR